MPLPVAAAVGIALKGFGKAYAILIPLGFIVIALFHFFNNTH